MLLSQQNGDLVLMRTGVRGDYIALQTEANELIFTDSDKCKSGEWVVLILTCIFHSLHSEPNHKDGSARPGGQEPGRMTGVSSRR